MLVQPKVIEVEYCNDKRFDYLLKKGQEEEDSLLDWLLNKPVEQKSQYQAHSAGTVLVEFECRGKKSGIATTESEVYIFKLSGLKGIRAIMIDTESLKRLCRKIYLEDPINNVLDLSKNPSNGGILVKVPLDRLVREVVM